MLMMSLSWRCDNHNDNHNNDGDGDGGDYFDDVNDNHSNDVDDGGGDSGFNFSWTNWFDVLLNKFVLIKFDVHLNKFNFGEASIPIKVNLPATNCNEVIVMII